MTTLETGTDELTARLEDGVAVVTLNRPEMRNALGDIISPAIRRMLVRVAEDAEIRCLLLTGAGTAFCAGGDVKGMGAGTRPDPPPTQEEVIADLTERQLTLTGALYALPKPTLAALPGPAAGAGMSIAMACDLRIAAESAFMTTAFARIGLSGDYGLSFFLTGIVGTARARELFYSAQRIPSDLCLTWGLVNRVVPDADLQEESMSWARELAQGPTRVFAEMKANLDAARREALPAVLAREARGTVNSAQTADHKEAVRAFVEKRSPRFVGD